MNTQPDSAAAPESSRIDVWLWAVRIFKTRSQAAAACRKGVIAIQGAKVKPSRLIRPGERIEIRKPFLTVLLAVKDIPLSRVGAKLVPGYCEDLTPPEKIALALELTAAVREAPSRLSGQGRPTKRDRREMERILESGGSGE